MFLNRRCLLLAERVEKNVHNGASLSSPSGIRHFTSFHKRGSQKSNLAKTITPEELPHDKPWWLEDTTRPKVIKSEYFKNAVLRGAYPPTDIHFNGMPYTPHFRYTSIPHRHYLQHNGGRPSDPLRVLFFGADEYSAATLRHLARLYRLDRHLICSLFVVRNTDERVVRPFKDRINFAHQRLLVNVLADLKMPHVDVSPEEFGPEWEPPESDAQGDPFNLIIAANFGMDIPGRVIKRMRYGALKMHPSMLPL